MANSRKPDGKALLFIFLTVLMSMIGMGIILPVMPTLIMELTGTDIAGAARLGGFLLTIYAVMQFLMSPILGALADRFGRRPVILLSLFSYAVDYLIMALAPTYAILFIGRLLSGGSAATYSAANAFIADVSPPEKRAANFGLLGAAFGLGFIIGPAIGGWLGEINPRLPFFAASAVIFANFLFGFIVLPETLSDENRRSFDWRRANPLGGLMQVAKYPRVIGVLFAYFLMQFAHNSFPAIWAYFAEAKYDWSEGQIGTSLAYVGFTAAIVQGYLTRKLIPVFGERASALFGMTVMAISLIGYAFFSPTGASMYGWITFGALAGFTMPAMQGLMSRATPPNAQGELQGAIASLMSITMASSPLLMTQVFSYYTQEGADPYFPGAPFLVSAILMIVAVIPFAIATRKLPPKQDETGAPSEPEATTSPAE